MTHSVSRPQIEPRLNSRYTLKETLGVRLGRRTLLGYDHQQQRPVIIKYLCYDDPLHHADRERFEREVNLLRQFSHGAIPAYIDDFEVSTDTHRGRMLVQAFVPGQSLFSLIQQGRGFNEADLKNIAQQVLTIVQYLHRQQPVMIHRDIKPSNLVLSTVGGTSPGSVHLVDFGLVQTTVDPDQMVIAGSDGYRPPEQLGDQATPASDLYSLGMTLIHLATGKHPTELPHRGLKVLFAQELGHLSRPFKHWLRWLTEPRQIKRPQSAAEALRVLQDVEQVFAKRLSAARLGQAIAHRAREQWHLFETAKPQGTQLQLEATPHRLEVIIPAVRFRGLDRGVGATVSHSLVGLIGLGAVGFGLVLLAEVATVALGQPYGWGAVAIAALFGLLLAAANTLAVWRGLASLVQRFRRRVYVQMEQDILLVGYASPLQSMQYVVNVCRQDIFDIDLRPDQSKLHLFLLRNRTRNGQLNYTLSAQELGLRPSEMHWLNDLLHVWLKRTSPTF
ncbi:MAG: serine/threonine-protein kinase [Cyanobacteria bacterium P01_A01_bin.105]